MSLRNITDEDALALGKIWKDEYEWKIKDRDDAAVIIECDDYRLYIWLTDGDFIDGEELYKGEENIEAHGGESESASLYDTIIDMVDYLRYKGYKLPNKYETPASPSVREALEDVCQNCGGMNPAWSTDNTLWNKVVGTPNGILCPTCFFNMADKSGQPLFGIKAARTALAGDGEEQGELWNEVRQIFMRNMYSQYLSEDEKITKIRDEAFDLLKQQFTITRKSTTP